MCDRTKEEILARELCYTYISNDYYIVDIEMYVDENWIEWKGKAKDLLEIL